MPHSTLYLVVGEAECGGEVEVLKCTGQIIETSLGVRLQERQLCHMITNKLFNLFFFTLDAKFHLGRGEHPSLPAFIDLLNTFYLALCVQG